MAMAYQQKLAEKLIILNDRGRGVLLRMNYIKKVREEEGGLLRTMATLKKKKKKRNLKESHRVFLLIHSQLFALFMMENSVDGNTGMGNDRSLTF